MNIVDTTFRSFFEFPYNLFLSNELIQIIIVFPKFFWLSAVLRKCACRVYMLCRNLPVTRKPLLLLLSWTEHETRATASPSTASIYAITNYGCGNRYGYSFAQQRFSKTYFGRLRQPVTHFSVGVVIRPTRSRYFHLMEGLYITNHNIFSL